MKLSIIIVNYNLAEEVKECLQSLFVNIPNEEFEVIVVDNASTDRKIEELPKIFNHDNQQNISFHFLNNNKGFGAGNNFGVTKAKGELVLFLNPDTIVKTLNLSRIFNLFDKYREIGVLGFKIADKNANVEYSFGKYPNLIEQLLNIVELSRLTKRTYYLTKTNQLENNLVEVDWVTGSALLIRKNVFEKIGCFDENYFMYYEEVDLCKRVKEIGCSICFYDGDTIVHAGSVSSKKNYYFFTKNSYQSKLYYTAKHFKGINKFLMSSLIFFQVSVQILLWTLLYPFSRDKSKSKLKGFVEILFTITKVNHK